MSSFCKNISEKLKKTYRKIWPSFILDNEDIERRKIDLKSDIEKIEKESWDKNAATYLEEARRLRDIETSRKNSADSKSQIYLASLLAIIPFLSALTSKDGTLGNLNYTNWYNIMCFMFLLFSIIYGIGAFISAFRALTVRSFNRIDIEDFIKESKAANIREYFAKEILKSVRSDRDIINDKINHVVIAHKLLFRMAICTILAIFMGIFIPNIYNIISKNIFFNIETTTIAI